MTQKVTSFWSTDLDPRRAGGWSRMTLAYIMCDEEPVLAHPKLGLPYLSSGLLQQLLGGAPVSLIYSQTQCILLCKAYI